MLSKKIIRLSKRMWIFDVAIGLKKKLEDAIFAHKIHLKIYLPAWLNSRGDFFFGNGDFNWSTFSRRIE